jgi:hypothetical protein
MKTLLIFACLIFLNPSLVRATPPTGLEIGYSVDSHTLFINADHPTDRDRHYIHEVIVTRNSQDKQYFYFSHQARADKFIVELDYTALPGDHLDVELYCSQGGSEKASIDVSSPNQVKELHETPLSNRK